MTQGTRNQLAALSRLGATAREVACHVHNDDGKLDRELRGSLTQLLHQIEQLKDICFAQAEERIEERRELQSMNA